MKKLADRLILRNNNLFYVYLEFDVHQFDLIQMYPNLTLLKLLCLEEYNIIIRKS